jgi:hypothetical protein
LACYLDWHNYEKRFLIKAPVTADQSHAEMAGIPRESISKERSRMFSRRAFLSLADLDGLEEKIWRKLFPSPGSVKSSYLPAFALA